MLTSQPVGVANEPLLDLGRYNYTHHSYMLDVYTHIILVVVGYLASFLFGKYEAPDNLTIYGYLRERKKG